MLTLLPADPPPDPLDALHEGVLADARRLRAIQVRLARRLLALRRAPSLYRFGATTFALYCETVGLSAVEGRDLASLGEAEMVRPDVIPRFEGGRLSLGKVSALAYLLRLPGPGPTPPPGTTRVVPAQRLVVEATLTRAAYAVAASRMLSRAPGAGPPWQTPVAVQPA